MSLRASIEKLQNIGSRLYSELSHRFSENALVREAWSAMSLDLEQQAGSLQAVAATYWRQLKPQEDAQTSAVQSTFRVPESIENKSLLDAITLSLDLEEPIILRFYVPLIRLLRANEASRELDFYILVKAHVTRLQRIVHSFSGDPILSRRSDTLMETFEKEVQAPTVAPTAVRAASRATPMKSKRPGEARKARAAERARQPRPRGKHSRIVPKRAKPMVKKIGIRRNRAHR